MIQSTGIILRTSILLYVVLYETVIQCERPTEPVMYSYVHLALVIDDSTVEIMATLQVNSRRTRSIKC